MKQMKEKVLSQIVSDLEKWVDASKRIVFIPEKVLQAEKIKSGLEKLLIEEHIEADVQISLSPLYNGDAIIEFEASEFEIRNIKQFYEIIRPLQNFEIYPENDDSIHFAGILPDVADVFICN